MQRFLITLAAAGALAVAGCGGDDNDSSSSSAPATTSTATSTPAASAGGSTVKIAMKNIQFSPKEVTAKVGQTVEWTNTDSVDHNVVADSGEDFKSKEFGNGETYSYKLDEAGTIKYECTLHPGMTGTITVTK
jgi:plastocyanin